LLCGKSIRNFSEFPPPGIGKYYYSIGAKAIELPKGKRQSIKMNIEISFQIEMKKFIRLHLKGFIVLLLTACILIGCHREADRPEALSLGVKRTGRQEIKADQDPVQWRTLSAGRWGIHQEENPE
jgi:hypothetical protein